MMKTKLLTLSDSTYEKLLTTFMPSKDMRMHLIDKKLTDSTLQELINGAPVSLETKRLWMSDLTNMEDANSDKDEDRRSYGNALSEYDQALSCLHESGIYTLEDCWYDYDIFEEKKDVCGVFTSYEDVKRYITGREKDDAIYAETDPNDGLPLWWTLKKWDVLQAHEPKQLYTYYLIHGEPYWFVDEIKKMKREERIRWRNSDPFLDSRHLWLPVPYKPGDIVEINTYPFGPKQPAIITEIDGDWIDIVTRNYKGNWVKGGIVHGFLGHSLYQHDYISALYRIRRWPYANLTDGDRIYE